MDCDDEAIDCHTRAGVQQRPYGRRVRKEDLQVRGGFTNSAAIFLATLLAAL